ncbi:hypothetical protein Drorol1_Dr00010573 [Drosera rotundifolia]
MHHSATSPDRSINLSKFHPYQRTVHSDFLVGNLLLLLEIKVRQHASSRNGAAVVVDDKGWRRGSDPCVFDWELAGDSKKLGDEGGCGGFRHGRWWFATAVTRGVVAPMGEGESGGGDGDGHDGVVWRIVSGVSGDGEVNGGRGRDREKESNYVSGILFSYVCF